MKLLLTALLLLILLGAVPKSSRPFQAQPELIALAAEQSETAVRVIIQKSDPQADLEEIIIQKGGRIINDLPIINAIVAEMEAEQAVNLSLDASVNWARLDSPVAKSQTVDTFIVRDEFNANIYANNDGTAYWSSDWQEVGENDGPTDGDLRLL